MRNALFWLITSAAALIPTFAFGAYAPGIPDNITEYNQREVALLPKYCKYTQLFRAAIPGGEDANEIARWTAVMGPIFNAMHHYCWGLMHTNRYLFFTRDPQHKTFHLNQSISEFDYVIQRAPPDFVLLPEILTKRGENLMRLGNTRDAITTLQQAIAAKPDYWPPYVALSDYYSRAGDATKARELLEKALSYSPNSKYLKTRLADLDTKRKH